MAVDNKPDDVAPDDEPGTPEKSDLDATEDEDDEDDRESIPVSAAKTGVGVKEKAIEAATSNPNGKEDSKDQLPPPRRELPFTRQKAAKSEEASSQIRPGVRAVEGDGGVDEETSSDDEL